MSGELVNRLSAALADRYRIGRELGAGGMATVYLAHDLKHDRDVAIKVLHQDLAAALGAERFLAEIKTTAKLQHPHILPLLDSGEAAGFLYYVMPYLKGESLRDRLDREKQLPIEDAVRIAREVADALGHAHGHDVIHRDIKPENILLQEGHALVADFGIALAVQSAGGQRMTQTGLSLGTPQYMSPEQAMGEKAIDARADIYALGAVTYEMLTGEPPFTGATVQAIVARVMSERPTPITTFRDTVPEHINAAVMKALAKLPADRFGTAGAYGTALDGIVEPTVASRIRAHRGTLLSRLVLVGLGIALIAAGWLARSTFADGPTAQATMRLSVTLPAGVHIPPTEWHTIALSRDGNHIAYVTNRGIEVRSLDSYESIVIPGRDQRNPTFSPDGRSLAFIMSDGIWRASLDGGDIARISTTLAYHATWGDDGRIYVADLGPTGIRAIRPDSGPGPELTKPDTSKGEAYHFSPEYLPGGTLLFTATGPSGGWGGAKILAVDVDAPGRTKLVLEEASSPRFIAPDRLAYLDGRGQLVVRRFDPKSLTVSGSPIVVDSVSPTHFGAIAHFTASRTGTVAYLIGDLSARERLVETNMAGQVQRVIASGVIAWPVHSPNGKSVIASDYNGSSAQLWLYSLDGDPPRRLTFIATEHETPLWSRDGSAFIYSREALGGRREIVLQSLQQADSMTVLLSRPFHMHVLAWSADRRWLVVGSFQGGVERLRLVDLTGAEKDRIIAEKSIVASLSPDDNTLAYCVEEEAGARLYSVSFPQLQARAQITDGAACWPRFSPDGRELFFVNVGGWSRPGTVHVVTRAGPRWGIPRPLFTAVGSTYNVGASPTRVLRTMTDSSRIPREIRVITKWAY